MSKCDCDNPYTYGESLAQEAKRSGGLLSVAPMMGMDVCLNCWNVDFRLNSAVNLSKTELDQKLEELKK